MMDRRKVVIMGAAGRDFHDFNVVFRDNEAYEVVAFTATQIPNIDGRVYPASLAGRLYPNGISIVAEDDLARIIIDEEIDEVIFGYSDVSHEHVMHAASLALAKGADFKLLGFNATALASKVPVISVCAVRTGSGKSQTTRRIAALLKERGVKTVAIRHSMPYGDLEKQVWQRYATLDDLDRYETTIEEREEYEPHIMAGTVVYAGVDYAEILKRAEEEAQVILWDGGNNDTPFLASDLRIVVADPMRAGHEMRYHPGEENLRMADVIVINKVDSAAPDDVAKVQASIEMVNPEATVVLAESPVTVDDEAALAGKKVLIVEDGPTVTHGEMAYGAGYVVAKRLGVAEIVDPRPYAVGTVKAVYDKYGHIGPVLPAVGYSPAQIHDLEATIDASPADVVLVATPIDLRRVAKFTKPAVRAYYELAEVSEPTLADVIDGFLADRVR